MEIISQHTEHEELSIYRVDADNIEGCGLKAKDVGCGFLLKVSAPGDKREIFLDDALLEALYNQMKARAD